MNLNFVKVQSVFPLDPISARALCLHCHQITNGAHMRKCATLSPDHPDGNLSSRRVAIITTDSYRVFAAPALCS